MSERKEFIDAHVDQDCKCGEDHLLSFEEPLKPSFLAEEMEKANILLAQAAPIGEYQRQLHNFKEAVEDRHELFRRDFKHVQSQMDFVMGDRYKDLYERVSYLESVIKRNKQDKDGNEQ